MCDPRDHIKVPVGMLCAQCTNEINPGDNGFYMPFLEPGNDEKLGREEIERRIVHVKFIAWHLDCFLRNMGVPAYRK